MNDTSLVLYLPFYDLDGGSFASKDAHGQVCTATGTNWTTHGRYFDGLDDTINCGDDESLDLREQLTVLAWVKVTSLADIRTICARDDTYNRNFLFYVHSAGFLVGNIWVDGVTKQANSIAGSFTVNRWYHSAMTYDGNVLKVFLDSIEGAVSEEVSGLVDNDDVTLYIGARPEAGTVNRDYLAGNIGEITMFNRALCSQEIREHFISTKWRYR